MSYTLRVQPTTDQSEEKQPITAQDLKQAVFTLQKRLRALKVKKSEVSPEGSDLVLVSASELTKQECETLRATLTKQSKLELKLVHPENRTLADNVAADPENEIVPGYELKILKDTDEDGNTTHEYLLVKRHAGLDGSDIIDAQELYGPYEGQLDIELSEQGAKKIFKLTKNMQHGSDRLAIVLDDEVKTAPVVQSTLSKRFQISGMDNAEKAKQLAAALLHPLQNPLVIEKAKRTPSHLVTDPSKKAAP